MQEGRQEGEPDSGTGLESLDLLRQSGYVILVDRAGEDVWEASFPVRRVHPDPINEFTASWERKEDMVISTYSFPDGTVKQHANQVPTYAHGPFIFATLAMFASQYGMGTDAILPLLDSVEVIDEGVETTISLDLWDVISDVRSEEEHVLEITLRKILVDMIENGPSKGHTEAAEQFGVAEGHALISKILK